MGELGIGGNTPPPVYTPPTGGAAAGAKVQTPPPGIGDGIATYNTPDAGKISGLPPPDGQPDAPPELPASTGYGANGIANGVLSLSAWINTSNQAGFRLSMMDIQKLLADAMLKEKDATIESNKSLFAAAKTEAQSVLDKAAEQKDQALQSMIGPCLELALSVGGAVATMRGVAKGLQAQKMQRDHDASFGADAMAGKSPAEMQQMQGDKKTSQEAIDKLTKKSKNLEIYGQLTSTLGRSISQTTSNAVEAAHVEGIAAQDAIAIMQRAMQEIFRRLAQAHADAANDMYELMKSLLQDVRSQQDADVQNYRG